MARESETVENPHAKVVSGCMRALLVTGVVFAAVVGIGLTVAVIASTGDARRELEEQLAEAVASRDRLVTARDHLQDELGSARERVRELESALAAAGAGPVAIAAPAQPAEAGGFRQPAAPAPGPWAVVANLQADVRAAEAAAEAAELEREAARKAAAEQAAAEAAERRRQAAERRREQAASRLFFTPEGSGIHQGLMTRNSAARDVFRPVGVWSVPEDDTRHSPTEYFMVVREDGTMTMRSARTCAVVGEGVWEISAGMLRIVERAGVTAEVIVGVPARYVHMDDGSRAPQMGQRLFFGSNRYWNFIGPDVDMDC